MNAKNVSASSPKVGGAILVAPVGTDLPEDAVTTLDAAFKEMGYIADTGVTNSNTPSMTDIKAWGGDIVQSTLTEKPDKFSFKLLEGLNIDVLKTIYGEKNVEEITVGEGGTEHKEIKIAANTKLPDNYSWVIDMILNDDKIKRIVIPQAKITNLADIVYTNTSAFGYDITLSAYPNASGDTHYEYIR